MLRLGKALVRLTEATKVLRRYTNNFGRYAITALQHFSESVRYNLQRLRMKRLNQLKECKTGHCN
jgi:hypothetical protein